MPAANPKSRRVAKNAGPVPRWPADAVERRPVAALTPYARNARTHSDEQVAQIARSIEEFGWTVPVLVDEAGGIIAGHGRILAAHRLGLTDVPVMVARGWSEEQKRLYVIADNQLALNADWDMDVLSSELAELRGAGLDLTLAGFDVKQLAEILEPTREPGDPEAVPGLPGKPISRRGDLYILGNHRIICGDSTKADDVERLLDGAKPHLMVTDPPYGVEYDPAWRGEAKSSDGKRVSLGVHATGKVLNDDKADWREAWALFPGGVAYVWCAPGPLNCVVHDSLAAAGIVPRMQIVWGKNQLVIGRGHYHAQHENCWYAVRKGSTAHWSGDRKQSTLWEIDKPQKSETGHSTQKPVECMRRPIENNSKAGDGVYEPFSGSGTTIIAAEMTGRRCYAVELNPAYVDVAVKRWEEFTGGKAERIRAK